MFHTPESSRGSTPADHEILPCSAETFHIPIDGRDPATGLYTAISGQTGHYEPQDASTNELDWKNWWLEVPDDIDENVVDKWQIILDSIPEGLPRKTPGRATYTSKHPKTKGIELYDYPTLPDWIPADAPPIILVAYKNSQQRITWADIAARCGVVPDPEKDLFKERNRIGNKLQMRAKRYRDCYGFDIDGCPSEAIEPSHKYFPWRDFGVEWNEMGILPGERYGARKMNQPGK
ncbi:MAG: hypothetical protein M1814_001527 [Vezdaea aestivalis]|nr:MAG: hypothetical protein M1814_001527 [Vezdaea aestivalis]